MINKKYLINKLLNLPEITEEDYLSLVRKRNRSNDDIELNLINERINLYNEKNMIINLIKTNNMNY
jgi:hypothetical protein